MHDSLENISVDGPFLTYQAVLGFLLLKVIKSHLTPSRLVVQERMSKLESY